MKRILKEIAPPFMAKAFRRLTTPPEPPPPPGPFSGQGQLFLDALGHATVYGEYGCGESTVHVGTATTLPILSVDTSSDWVDQVTGQLAGREGVDLRWVDVGPLGEWGTPLGYSRREHFRSYIMSPWNRHLKPDMVLIDGRFRVACFAATMLEAPRGSTVIFDDYPYRPEYHVVEELAGSPVINGRQARFTIPPNVNLPAASAMLEKFEYVTG